MSQQPLYVYAATAISPQHSFRAAELMQPLVHFAEGKLHAQDASYSDYISPVAIRRMSRIMKMTISAAMECLSQAGVKAPDAIITGTGSGGVLDMEQVVKDLRRFDEGSLNPTAFIQSTYNSPNGWIAMQTHATCYNQTFVHRGCSFELALLDAQGLLAESRRGLRLLVGCYDELSDEYTLIRGRRGYWKVNPPDSLALLQHADTAGTIAGEGVNFFVFGSEPEQALACVAAIRLLHHADAASVADAVREILSGAGLAPSDLGLIMLGLNGDVRQSHLYNDLLTAWPQSIPVVSFKPLCGEYETASGFGLWLGIQVLNGWTIPQELQVRGVVPTDLGGSNVLVVNHFIQGEVSILLLRGKAESCR